MNKIVFVVLHYKALEVTDECISCLLNQNYKNFNILVIDNYSNDNSAERLRLKYGSIGNLNIIQLEENYGFAKANDIGFLVAKYRYNADYIVVINNDLFIRDNDFCSKLVELDFDDSVGVVGPDIINLNGTHQNPSYNCYTTLKQVERAIIITKIKILLLSIVRKYKNNRRIINNYESEKKVNIPLHGSCLIFLKPFISKMNYAFYPDTFLYGEEELLYYLCMKNHFKTVYEPSIKVEHMEDASTESVCRSDKEKRLFQLRNSLQSLYVIKKIIIR